MSNVNETNRLLIDTVISMPWMNELMKFDGKFDGELTRTGALLLSSLVDRAIATKDEDKASLVSYVSPDDLQQLKAFADKCLSKAGLGEVSEKLKKVYAVPAKN